MKVNKATPLLVVDAIEPALPFWAALGYRETVEVPHGDALGFVILVDGDRELMLQTRASLREDLGLEEQPPFAMYLDVDDHREARDACGPMRVLIADRVTPYGAREAWVLDPAGNLVGFASH